MLDAGEALKSEFQVHAAGATGLEAAVINNTPQALGLMRDAYNKVFVPAFPDENDRESLEQMEGYIQDPSDKDRVRCIVVGKNLNDPTAREIVAISYCCLFDDHAVGTLSYNAVAPKYRNQGIGGLMVEERNKTLSHAAKAKGIDYQGTFIEIHNPDVVSPEADSIDPSVRRRIFEKWGARKVPIDYVSPPLDDEKTRSTNFIIMAYPDEHGVYPKKEGVFGYIHAQYDAFGFENKENDPEFVRMLKAVEAWDGVYDKPGTAPTPDQKRELHV